MEVNRLENLTESGQEIQLNFAGPIKAKSRGDVYIIVAVDRFSKWPTAQICKRTDSRTVIKFLTKYCTDNGTPRTIRTDNGSCFKSQEFKNYCKGENKKGYVVLRIYTQEPDWLKGPYAQITPYKTQTRNWPIIWF